MMKKLILVFVAVIVLSVSTTSQADPTTQTYGVFDITFYNSEDAHGSGYTGAQNWTAGQMADVGASLQPWSSLIGNVPGRQIEMDVVWYNFSGGILGGSASARIGDGTTQYNYGEYVWREGFSTSNPSGYDTFIVYDADAAGYGWNFGTDAPGTGDIDFRSVVTHEIGHSLGWSDTYRPPGSDDWGYLGGSYQGLTEWDKNLVDSAGNRALSGGKGTPGNFNQTDNPIYWDGANAVSYYGDDVPIFAPNPFAPGSSLSHLDYGTFGTSLLMGPYIGLGDMNRTVSDLEWAMMRDMGWAIVPVPAAVLLGILGLGVVGIKLRKYA